MWSQSTRLVREGALGPSSFCHTYDSIQSNQVTIKGINIKSNQEVNNSIEIN